MRVMIGVDPHKGSHTAVAIDGAEETIGQLKVRTSRRQAGELLAWAAPFECRTWAIESAGGLGHLLAQQLVAAGEEVLDVPATLASRIRVLASGKSNKNDPNDARSVAIAALRAPALSGVRAEDHVTIMRLLAKRNVDLGRSRNRTCCRLHALICDLVPGGISKEMVASGAEAILERVAPATAVEVERKRVALELLDDLRRLDAQLKESKRRIREAVAVSGTKLTDLFGIGPVVACMIIGYTAGVGRFGSRHRYASYNGTAPVEVSSGGRVRHRLSRRGNRQLNHAIHIAAVTQVRHHHCEGRIFYERKLAEGKTRKEALRALKRRISDAVYRQLQADANNARR